MLYGTYQGLPATAKLLDVDPQEWGLRGDECEALDSIWLFPMPSASETFAHSVTTEPAESDMFLVYDFPDEPTRIDKVAHHARLSKGDTSLSGLQSSDVPLSQSEFIVSLDDLSGIGPILMSETDTDCAYSWSFQTPFGDYVLKGGEVTDYFLKSAHEFEDLFWQTRNQVFHAPPVHGPSAMRFASPADRFFQASFEYTWLTEAFRVASDYSSFGKSPDVDEFTHAAESGRLSRNPYRLTMLHGLFTSWATQGSHSRAEYEGIFNTAKNLVIDDDNVLLVKTYAKGIEPSNPCPCNSGRDWGSCHGRIHADHIPAGPIYFAG